METFEAYRGYLFAIAYRMLGSAMDAEDMVQETYLRYQAAQETIYAPRAYLTTILTRLCMDQLQLARRKREVYVGPWLPEPILTAELPAADPEQHADMDESIALAFLVLLEQLQPFERAVFLLRESFDYEFAEIASMLGKSEAACRRSFSRARQHLRDQRPRFPASRETHRQLLESYIKAVEQGELQTLMTMLADDVTLWADAGGKRKQAALRPVRGPDAVARMSVGTLRFLPEGYTLQPAQVNGQPAIIIRAGDQVFSVLTIEVEAARIRAIYVLANPDKLAYVA